jgi:hypothetical protein
MIDLPTFLPYLSMVAALAITVGGILAFRQGYSKMAIAIREDVITALNSQIEAFKDQVEALEKEIERQKVVISTIRVALRLRGLYIRVNGDMITMEDRGRTRTTQMRIGQKTPEENGNGNEEEENGNDDGDAAKHKKVK